MIVCRWLILIQFVLLAAQANGQTDFSYNPVPLQKEISVNILGCDKQALQCYNLYGYTYVTDVDSFYGEFIVMKDLDTFKAWSSTKIKFCKPHELSLMIADNTCRALPVENGIEIAFPGKEKMYLNFDPEMPDAIFIPCK